MENIEKASLILKTNQAGIINTARTSITWNNINLRTLLGSMYDKYETFNLSINSIQTTESLLSLTLLTARACYINISGLPFLNNTYDVQLQSNTSTANLCSFTVPSEDTSQLTFYQNHFLTFSKHQESLNISLEYRQVIDNNPPSSLSFADQFPHTVFSFSIYGIPKIENDSNGSRM